jgi:hypothetical protein
MGSMKKVSVYVAVSIVVASLFGGCASSKQARSVEGKGFLVDYSMLQKGKDDQALLRYQNPKANIAGYTKVMLDPVLIAKPAKATQEQMADLQKLATNFYVYLSTELGKDYTMVSTPEPGTLRVQAAITGAEKSNAVSNTLSSVLPIGIGVSLAKDFATGKPVGVGEATAEMKVTDASTGELLGAAVDRRVGGKNPDGIIDSWAGANSAMEYWAKRLSYVLCMERGSKECVKP